ncbi:MAG TPA: DNA mismatch repair endonuclease MutL [Bacteroidales bacterium]|nr:DNA mismatch repair endonuclease MutL [Bacteroidales bacterium]
MPDLIQLLPESVANQIAAGEVIQRPSSAVKELLENAIDAGANVIQLIIKDAGKTLIQVVDNGCGMSPMDARLCFERHATSKIHQANDLFAIRTLGFRGEALASIAAISQVELRTRRHEDEIGTQVLIEGSELINQQPIQCSAGSSFLVKNLFYNVPARRAFLKSEAVEMRHIIEEFERVALVFPEIQFSLIHNGRTIFQLGKSSPRQRIIQIMGNHLNSVIVPVEEQTDFVKIHGFTSKPEYFKKVRGEQYLFTNGRFVKIPYLQHSIESAYEGLIPQGSFPSYFIHLEIDPSKIDVNIHPSKTEIKFLNENLIYAVLKAAVRKSIGQFSLSGIINFDEEWALGDGELKPGEAIKPPKIQFNPHYNPFQPQNFQSSPEKRNLQNWQKLYEFPENVPKKKDENLIEPTHLRPIEESENGEKIRESGFLQVHQKYLITVVKSGMMLIDIEKAYQRIFYEDFLQSFEKEGIPSQQEIFPLNIHLGQAESVLVNQMKPTLALMGFNIDNLSNNTFVIQGIPNGMDATEAKESLETIIEHLLKEEDTEKADIRFISAKTMATTLARHHLRPLKEEEMRELTDKLFSTTMPSISPLGETILKIITLETIEELLK